MVRKTRYYMKYSVHSISFSPLYFMLYGIAENLLPLGQCRSESLFSLYCRGNFENVYIWYSSIISMYCTYSSLCVEHGTTDNMEGKKQNWITPVYCSIDGRAGHTRQQLWVILQDFKTKTCCLSHYRYILYGKTPGVNIFRIFMCRRSHNMLSHCRVVAKF